MQKVVPAILTDNPAELKRQLEILKNHTKWVQIDVMDGKFVPSVSVNISELGEAAPFFSLEIHLMVQDPENYLEDCNGVGAKRVYFHAEGTRDPGQVLSAMENYSFQKGIALNPETKVGRVAPYLERVDAILFLSVVPGAQGHEFIPQVAEKIPAIKALKENLLVGMDGGVSEANIQDIFAKGVDYVAVGSGVWTSADPLETLRKLEETAEKTKNPHKK